MLAASTPRSSVTMLAGPKVWGRSRLRVGSDAKMGTRMVIVAKKYALLSRLTHCIQTAHDTQASTKQTAVFAVTIGPR